MITHKAVSEFFAGHRIAVVGAADRKDSFGRAICSALVDHGFEPIPVHPTEAMVDGRRCFPHLADIPEPVDGVIVMVPAPVAESVVEDAAAAGVRQVWLFKGIGGAGAVSPEVIEACRRHGIEPVAGACPLMFLEPVGGAHRFHRVIRRARGTVERAGAST
jgi:predicted CoA-binding protein